MSVPSIIASAAENYRFNSGLLPKLAGDLAPQEWLRRPNDSSNHIAWIAGHMVWTRKQLLGRLGTEWSLPWLNLFARGEPCASDAAYPSQAELLDAWSEASRLLENALDSATEELLAQPATSGPPSPDGKMSGIVSFLAIHETYHLGQISYLRGWLGRKGLMG